MATQWVDFDKSFGDDYIEDAGAKNFGFVNDNDANNGFSDQNDGFDGNGFGGSGDGFDGVDENDRFDAQKDGFVDGSDTNNGFFGSDIRSEFDDGLNARSTGSGLHENSSGDFPGFDSNGKEELNNGIVNQRMDKPTMDSQAPEYNEVYDTRQATCPKVNSGADVMKSQNFNDNEEDGRFSQTDEDTKPTNIITGANANESLEPKHNYGMVGQKVEFAQPTSDNDSVSDNFEESGPKQFEAALKISEADNSDLQQENEAKPVRSEENMTSSNRNTPMHFDRNVVSQDSQIVTGGKVGPNNTDKGSPSENTEEENNTSPGEANTPWWTNNEENTAVEQEGDHWWTSYSKENEDQDKNRPTVHDSAAENHHDSSSAWWENTNVEEANDSQHHNVSPWEGAHDTFANKENEDSLATSSDPNAENKVTTPVVQETENLETMSSVHDDEKKSEYALNSYDEEEDGELNNVDSTLEKEASSSQKESIPMKDISSNTNRNVVKSEPRPVQFHNPYPLPQAPPPPRHPAEIIKDHTKPDKDLPIKWTAPKQELQEVLLAAKGPSLARRSNACGALKVLTSKKKKQFTLARTIGLLDSLVFAANESPPSAEADDTAVDARTRAVTAIMYLSEPKENRVLVFEHPGLAATLVKVIKDDIGEARLHACSALAVLAKTTSNREGMIKVEGLTTALSAAVRGKCDDAGFLHPSSFGGDKNSSSNEDHATSKNNEKNKKHSKKVQFDNNKNYDKLLSLARMNACAALSHLSKYCPVSPYLCKSRIVMENILLVCTEFDSPIHTRCVEILCNLTRFQANNSILSNNDTVVDIVVQCGKSKTPEDRIWAVRAIQNLTSEPTSKVNLATSNLLTLLSASAISKEYDEQHAAVAALMNLATEPGAIVPLTNTKNVVATLVHIAHSPESSPDVRKMACDALATIGLWLQTLAGAGTVPDEVPDAVLPTHKASGWLRWE